MLSVDPLPRVVRYPAAMGHSQGEMSMFRRQSDALPVRPRVTPDPEAAAELQRRMEALQYKPELGFHRDRLQRKAERPLLRLVK
jgi:hypothetical protein